VVPRVFRLPGAPTQPSISLRAPRALGMAAARSSGLDAPNRARLERTSSERSARQTAPRGNSYSIQWGRGR
jgi:hypothetical protein